MEINQFKKIFKCIYDGTFNITKQYSDPIVEEYLLTIPNIDYFKLLIVYNLKNDNLNVNLNRSEFLTLSSIDKLVFLYVIEDFLSVLYVGLVKYSKKVESVVNKQIKNVNNIIGSINDKQVLINPQQNNVRE